MIELGLSLLCSVSICDSIVEKIILSEDIEIYLSATPVSHVVFRSAKACELSIKGYEVLDENEEVVFDMPDVEIFGDMLPDAIATLMDSEPHAVSFSKGDDMNSVILTLTDNTDTYELKIQFDAIYAE